MNFSSTSCSASACGLSRRGTAVFPVRDVFPQRFDGRPDLMPSFRTGGTQVGQLVLGRGQVGLQPVDLFVLGLLTDLVVLGT